MEILPLGEFDPVYRSTLDVQNGELPVLPLSIYGAVSRLILTLMRPDKAINDCEGNLGALHLKRAAYCQSGCATHGISILCYARVWFALRFDAYSC